MPAKQEKIIARDCAHLQKLIAQAIKKDGPNCNLNHIDVSKVCRMEALFKDSQFNGDISRWNVSNVVNMKDMFCNSQFNGNIGNWNVSNVTNMSGMFKNSVFNHSIAEWNVSKVTNMKEMFRDSQFDDDIGQWNVSNVKYMQKMFYASCFCGDISKWDVSNVKNMEKMFYDTPYNMDISKWNISSDCQREEMFNLEQKDFVQKYFKLDYYRKLKNAFSRDFKCISETKGLEFFNLNPCGYKKVYARFQNDFDKSIFSYTFLFHLIAHIALMDESKAKKTLSEGTLKKFGTKTGWFYLGYDMWSWLPCSENSSNEKFPCKDLKSIIKNFDLVNEIGDNHDFIRACIFEKLQNLLKEDMLTFGIPNDSAERVLNAIATITPRVLSALSRLKV